MRDIKQLGIWLDHTTAVVMELVNNSIKQSIVKSEFTREAKENSLSKSEKLMNSKEQHDQHDYYKELGETIRDFDEVILFGPTSAKDELFNLLASNHKFSNIKITVKNTDKMNDNQMHAFVKSHYN